MHERFEPELMRFLEENVYLADCCEKIFFPAWPSVGG